MFRSSSDYTFGISVNKLYTNEKASAVKLLIIETGYLDVQIIVTNCF